MAKESEPEEETKKETDEEQSSTQQDFSSLALDEKIEYIVINLLGDTTTMDLPRIEEIETVPFYGEEGQEGNTAFITLNDDDILFSVSWAKQGLWIDSTKLFEYFFELEEITRVDLKWQLPLVDTYGNTKLGVVMEIMLTRDTAEKINWDNFLFQNLPKVADIYQEHPAFSN